MYNVDFIYPIGSLYLTTNKDFNPNTAFGGTWEQLTGDAYLKFVTSSAGEYNGTSSNHKIPLTSIPSHDHGYTWMATGSGGDWAVSGSRGSIYVFRTTKSGGDNAYYPYYYGVYAWHRTA